MASRVTCGTTNMAAADIEPARGSERLSARFSALMAALFVVFAIQLYSPLRINADAALILRLTAMLTDGRPYLIDGARPIFPIGVPLTFSLMERAGAANSFGFGLFNLVCMCGAAYATWTICARLA